MSIDILIVFITVLFAILGYKKGIIVSILNLLVLFLYFYFVQDVINFFNNIFPNMQFFNDLNNNLVFRYIFLGVVSFFVLIFSSMIFKKIVRKSFLSFIDRVGGLLISVFISYLLVCLLAIAINSLSNFIEINQIFKDSFFISEQFNKYNILYWWWYSA